MREIEFRAWDKMNAMFVYFTVKLGKETFLDPTIYEGELYLYIGLKDKKGKKGYFADLVKWGWSIYQVIWNVKEGIAQLIKCSGTEVFATLKIKEIENGEIIGNIYENSELLDK